MRRPKNGFDDGQRQPRPPPPSEPQKKKKEPVQAFSNVTTPMSDCSPSDRPMSDFSSIEEKTSPGKAFLGLLFETVLEYCVFSFGPRHRNGAFAR